MKIVFETGGQNYFKQAKTKSAITMMQAESGKRLFTVVYGLQEKSKLTYSDACAELGACILHMLCCDGIASNEGA